MVTTRSNVKAGKAELAPLAPDNLEKRPAKKRTPKPPGEARVTRPKSKGKPKRKKAAPKKKGGAKKKGKKDEEQGDVAVGEAPDSPPLPPLPPVPPAPDGPPYPQPYPDPAPPAYAGDKAPDSPPLPPLPPVPPAPDGPPYPQPYPDPAPPAYASKQAAVDDNNSPTLPDHKSPPPAVGGTGADSAKANQLFNSPPGSARSSTTGPGSNITGPVRHTGVGPDGDEPHWHYNVTPADQQTSAENARHDSSLAPAAPEPSYWVARTQSPAPVARMSSRPPLSAESPAPTSPARSSFDESSFSVKPSAAPSTPAPTPFIASSEPDTAPPAQDRSTKSFRPDLSPAPPSERPKLFDGPPGGVKSSTFSPAGTSAPVAAGEPESKTEPDIKEDDLEKLMDAVDEEDGEVSPVVAVDDQEALPTKTQQLPRAQTPTDLFDERFSGPTSYPQERAQLLAPPAGEEAEMESLFGDSEMAGIERTSTPQNVTRVVEELSRAPSVGEKPEEE